MGSPVYTRARLHAIYVFEGKLRTCSPSPAVGLRILCGVFGVEAPPPPLPPRRFCFTSLFRPFPFNGDNNSSSSSDNDHKNNDDGNYKNQNDNNSDDSDIDNNHNIIFNLFISLPSHLLRL